MFVFSLVNMVWSMWQCPLFGHTDGHWTRAPHLCLMSTSLALMAMMSGHPPSPDWPTGYYFTYSTYLWSVGQAVSDSGSFDLSNYSCSL